MELYVAFAEVGGAESRPIHFIRTGTFTDANNRQVVVSGDLLDDLVAAFNQGAAGQDIPIDVDHKRESAAGWITKVFREGDRLIAIPRWNELGRQLVGDQVYRYLSATIDLGRKVLLSVSLTNFPAIKGLPPIELAEAIANGVREEAQPAGEKEGSNEIVVIMLGGIMEAQEEPKVEEVVTPVAPVALGELEVKVTKAVEAPAVGGEVNLADAVKGMRLALMAELGDQIKAEFAKVKTEGAQVVVEALAQMRQEQELVAFSERITTSGAHALPVEPKVIQAALSGLPVGKQAEIRSVLETITTHGTVDFSEIGTAQGKAGGRKPKLSGGERQVVAELMANGMTLDQVFEDAGDLLGAKDSYDLSEFIK